jgi:hypothetical protein
MRAALIIPVLIAAVAPPQSGQPTETKVARKSLDEQVRLADLIVVAEAREVKVEHATETFEYHRVACAVREVLKGRTPEKAKEIEVIIQLKLREAPPADRLDAGRAYVLLLNGTWSYLPITPHDGIVPAAKEYPGPDGKTLTHEKYLATIREMVKRGPRIRQVSLNVRMEGGWMADFVVHSGGRTTGGHMSGGELPFHHMEKGVLEGEPLKAVIDLADKVHRSGVPSRPVIGGPPVVSIRIEPFVGEAKTYPRLIKEPFADKDLAELDRLLHKHRIGAW